MKLLINQSTQLPNKQTERQRRKRMIKALRKMTCKRIGCKKMTYKSRLSEMNEKQLAVYRKKTLDIQRKSIVLKKVLGEEQ